MKIPKFANPVQLNASLLQASLFLTAWETLKLCVIGKVKGFLCIPLKYDGNGKMSEKVSDSYKKIVKSANGKEFIACRNWLSEMKALDNEDLETIDTARKHRNSIAHEIVEYITSDEKVVSRDLIERLYKVIKKLEIWWITEIELLGNPNFIEEDLEEIKYANISGAYSLLMEILLPIFDGDFNMIQDLSNELKKLAQQGE